MKFSKISNRFRRINERRMDTIDIIDELYNSRNWDSFIEKTIFKQFPDAGGFDEVPSYALEELLDDIKDEAIKRIENGDMDISDSELKLLDLKITPKIAYAMYNAKLKKRDEYNKGWTDCYQLLDVNGII